MKDLKVGTEFRRGDFTFRILSHHVEREAFLLRALRHNVYLDIETSACELVQLLDVHSNEDAVFLVLKLYRKQPIPNCEEDERER